LIRLFSFAGDTVLDPFLGTGTTSIAAAATGRNSIGNEVDAAYVDIARKRMEETIRRHSLPSFTVSFYLDHHT
jgi:site-specific DNA-methyltransferase (adenine-specific)